MLSGQGAYMGAFECGCYFLLLNFSWLCVRFIPIIGSHTTKSFKNNDLRRLSFSWYNLFLRDSMTNSCRYG